MPAAFNKQTGELLVLDPSGQWVEPKRARNPQTGEEVYLDGDQWKPVPSQGSPQPTLQQRQPGGFVDALTQGVQSMTDQLLAGFQRTSPVTQTMQGEPTRLRLGDVVQLDAGLGYTDTGGKTHFFDPEKHVVLRGADGRLGVFTRTPETDEGPLPSAGRVLGVGAITGPLTRLAGGAGSSPMQSLARDFQRVGVDPSLPAVSQSASIGRTANVIKETPIVGIPVQRGAERTMRQTAEAAERTASGFGAARTPVEAGRAAQQGAGRFVDAPTVNIPESDVVRLPTRATSFHQKAEALFDRVGVPNDRPVELGNTLEALGGVADRFPSSPEFGQTLIDPKFRVWFDRLREAGSLTWGELKEFRSFVGRRLREGAIVSDIPRADLERLYAGISRDLEAAASEAGKLRQFQRANRYYRAGLDRINNALKQVYDVNNPEAAYQQILSAAARGGSRADIRKLRALRRSLSDEQWGDVASTIIRQAGQKTPGATDPLSADNFDVNRFVTNFSSFSDEAKDVLFNSTGNKELRDALDSLVRVAGAQKNVERLRNFSQTGPVVITAGMFTAGLNEPLKTALAALTATGTGALMMSPRFVRWLAAANKVNTQPQMASHIARLRGIARTEPDLAPAIQAFAEQLQGDAGREAR